MTAIDLKETEFRLHEQLVELRTYIAENIHEGGEGCLDEAFRLLRSRHWVIAVMGEFRRGKSSLINALLGMRMLPADVTPTTATINRITYGERMRVTLKMRDGTEREAEPGRLEDYVTKLTDKGERNSALIREAVIFCPTVLCQNNVDIIDTPGLNDDVAMTGVTIENLEQVDAVVAAVSALSPFSEVECDFVCQLMEAPNVHDVLFAVTFIDQLEEDERGRMLEYIGKRISEQVLSELERRGACAEVLAKARAVIARPRLYPVSAKQALESFCSGDRALLEQSGFEQFKQALFTQIIAQQGIGLLEKVTLHVKQDCTALCSRIKQRAANYTAMARAFAEEAERLNAAADNAVLYLDKCLYEQYDRLCADISDIDNQRESIYKSFREAIQSCQPGNREMLVDLLRKAAGQSAAALVKDESFNIAMKRYMKDAVSGMARMLCLNSPPLTIPVFEKPRFMWSGDPVAPVGAEPYSRAKSVTDSSMDNYIAALIRTSNACRRSLLGGAEQLSQAYREKARLALCKRDSAAGRAGGEQEAADRLSERLGVFLERCRLIMEQYMPDRYSGEAGAIDKANEKNREESQCISAKNAAQD